MEAVLALFLGLTVGGVGLFWYLSSKIQKEKAKLAAEHSEQSNILAETRARCQLSEKEAIEYKGKYDVSQSELVKNRELVARLESSNQALNQQKAETATDYKTKISEVEKIVSQLRSEKEVLSIKLTEIEQKEPIRQREYDQMVLRSNQYRENLEKDRESDEQKKAALEVERQEKLRETWARHEVEVEEKMRLLCQQLAITYIDKEKFPFTGKPDNCVNICEEYVVFDSKSPQGDDLSNFPTYIRAQAEAAKKYAKHDDVKKDIYLVVPTNAIQTISETFLPHGTHRVHVITVDSLSVVLMALKRVEDYEFAEKMSPEDRDSIVSIIGKFAHKVKRRLQIDSYINNDFLSLLTEAENLPADILEEAQKIERTLKLNPPIQKRAKRIELEVIKKDAKKLEAKVLGQEINLGPELGEIERIPLISAPKENGT